MDVRSLTLDGSPAAEAERVVRTHCPYCAFQCGMTLSSRMGAPGFTVAADAQFPVNRGQMCIKGFTSAELLAHPARLTTPLVRDRATGELRPASWDVALDEIASGIRSIQGRHGREAMAVFGSGALTNEKAYLLGKFARLALGTPHVDYNGRYCMASAAAGQNKAFGVDRGLPFPVSDIAQAQAVMLWGSNVADTMPPLMQWFERQRADGGKLIVVDPRRTETARNADLHLQLTPGSDLALANGMMLIAIEEGFVDQAYVDERTNGFDAVRRTALAYHPARVERLTGVSESQMREAVRLLGRNARSMILSGRGPEQQSKGADTVCALINLMLAMGKCGKPFSGFGTLTGQGNGQGGREHGQKADQLPGYRSVESPADREHVARVWGVEASKIPGKGKSAYELCASLGADLRGLIVLGSNLAVASPNSGRVEANLAKLELLVVCDAFLNETARHAHVVLPVPQWAEEAGTMTNLEGRVILRRPAASPPAGVRSDIEILCELARRLGVSHGFDFGSPREVFEEFRRATAGARADYSGMTYERIDREKGIHWPCPSEDHPGTPRLFAERFHHADGRARFVAADHRPAGEEPDAEYPVYFTTGRYREHYNSGAQTRLVGKLVEAKPEPELQIHPRLAGQLEVSDGERVVVESRRGRVEFVACVAPDVRPDTVFAPFHWGGKQAANVLTNPALDPTSRMPEFKICAVRVRSARN